MITGRQTRGSADNEGNGNNKIAGNNIQSRSEGATLSGKNIYNGSGNFNITCVSCDGVAVMDNCSGVSIINSNQCFVGSYVSGCSLLNCSGVTVQNGVYNFTGVNLQNINIDYTYNGTVQVGLVTSVPIKDRNIKKTATFSTEINYDTYYSDATGGAIVANLVNTGIEYTIKKIDSSANAVTLTPGVGVFIDGASSRDILVQYESLTVGYSTDDGVWYIK